MRFTIFQDSQVGDRDTNEDRVGYSYSRDVLLLVIADGMGGHLQGEVAAEIAVAEITRRFQQEARNKLKRPFDFLVSAIQSAHRAIVSHAGIPELVAYIVLATVLANASLWRQPRITDRHLVRVRHLRDIRLTPLELSLVAVAFVLLAGAALIETSQIARLQSL